MIPNYRLVLTAPEWLVVTMIGFVIAAAMFRIGLDIYLANVKVEDYERVVDDADKAARGVERHDDELEEIRVHLASADSGPIPIDTTEAPAVQLAGGLRAGRPVPYRRADSGRHSA